MRADPPPSDGPPGIYVHIPFCRVKCSYCDFAVAAGQDHRVDRYIDALVREIEDHGRDIGGRPDSVYFGGGTPSRVPPAAIERLLASLHARHPPAEDPDVSLEANPEDLDDARIAGLVAAGVRRITVGIQSLDDDVLRGVGRVHGGAVALDAVRRLRAGGIRSVGIDLIGGLPGERMERWGETVRRIVDSAPDHVSFYLLETEQPSALARAIERGTARVADDDAQARAYDRTAGMLVDAGYEAYEISNFARPGHRSRHNEKYWGDAWYAGYGLGAHGYARGARRGNLRVLGRYLRAVEAGRDPVDEVDPWDPVRRIEEVLFLGLRRAEGIEPDRIAARYDVDVRVAYAEVWERHADGGRLEVPTAGPIRLTARGRLASDAVFRDLIGAFRPGVRLEETP